MKFFPLFFPHMLRNVHIMNLIYGGVNTINKNSK